MCYDANESDEERTGLTVLCLRASARPRAPACPIPLYASSSVVSVYIGMDKCKWNTKGEIQPHRVVSESISKVYGSLVANIIVPKFECTDFLCDEFKK